MQNTIIYNRTEYNSVVLLYSKTKTLPHFPLVRPKFNSARHSAKYTGKLIYSLTPSALKFVHSTSLKTTLKANSKQQCTTQEDLNAYLRETDLDRMVGMQMLHGRFTGKTYIIIHHLQWEM